MVSALVLELGLGLELGPAGAPGCHEARPVALSAASDGSVRRKSPKSRLQPYVMEAATACNRGCNCM